MSKTIEDLREHLFAAIAGVRNGTVSIEQAKTIGDLSQVIVNTAKVEVDFVRATERRDSRFLSAAVEKDDQVEVKPAGALPNGIVGIRRHICKDD